MSCLITTMHSACFGHLARSYEAVDLPVRRLSRRRKVGTWSLLGGGLPRILPTRIKKVLLHSRALPVGSHGQPS
ncbi:hypothetical protein K438DRAFT_1798715, partial [Mycena galopus ATCC 62051]